MNSFELLEKRSVVLRGRKTSISLEKCFWEELKRIAHERNLYIGELVAQIGEGHPHNLSSAVRQTVVADLKARAFPVALEPA